MRKRLFLCLTFVALLVGAAAVPAAEDKPTVPTVVVRVASLDELSAHAKFLAALADQEEVVKQIAGGIEAQGDPKAGIFGIDPKLPLGFYGTVGPQGFDSSAVLMLPIADEETFLTTLRLFNVKPKKGKDDVYSFEAEVEGFSAPLYLRFANGYAYLTALTRAAVTGDALQKPSAVFPTGAGGVVWATFRIDQISPELKQLALGQIGLRLANLRESNFATESKAQEKFWEEAFDDLVRNRLGPLFADGKHVTLRLDLDRKSGELSIEATAEGKPGSKLAASLTELGQASSLFGRVASKDAAARVAVNWAMTEKLRKALAAVVDESVQKSLDRAKDAERREKGKKFLDVVGPTLKSGELDAVVELRPAGKLHTLVVGAKIKDGEAVEKALRELMTDLPEGDRTRVKLDAELVGSLKVHRIDAKDDYDAKFKAMFGDGPIYLALRSDALLLTAGEGALEAMNELATAKPGPAPVAQVDLNVRRLTLALATQRDDATGDIEKAASEALKDGDTIHAIVEGGKAIKVRLAMKAAVLKFLVLLGKAQKQDK